MVLLWWAAKTIAANGSLINVQLYYFYSYLTKMGRKKYFTCGKIKKGWWNEIHKLLICCIDNHPYVNQVNCQLNLGFIIQTIDFGMQKELLRETDSLNKALNTTINMEMVARNQLRIKQNPTNLESVKAISTLRKRYLNQQPLSNLPRKCSHMIQNYKNFQKLRKKKHENMEKLQKCRSLKSLQSNIKI